VKVVKELRSKLAMLEGSEKSLKLELETEKGKSKSLQGQIETLKAAKAEIVSTHSRFSCFFFYLICSHLAGSTPLLNSRRSSFPTSC